MEHLRFSPEGEPRKIFVDIDETICFYPGERNYRYYDLAEPSYDNIAKINKLYDEGNIITYWTARGSSQPDNIAKINKLYDKGDTITYWTARGSSQLHNVLRIEQYKRLTKSQLDEWGCRYHFLELGNKPQFDLFIDDKAKRIEEI